MKNMCKDRKQKYILLQYNMKIKGETNIDVSKEYNLVIVCFRKSWRIRKPGSKATKKPSYEMVYYSYTIKKYFFYIRVMNS